MSWRHDAIGVAQRLRALVRRRRKTRDIEDELAFHLAMRQADHERDGRAAEDARLAARRQFGNPTLLKEQTRDMWTFASFESLVQDSRYALRTLWKSPGFSVVATLVLAIGIGANTAMFSLIDAMLLRGVPYPDAERLVVLIGNVRRAAAVERRGNSFPDHADWRANSSSFDDIAAYTQTNVILASFDEPERIAAEAVSAGYFDILGVSPQHGRVFARHEDEVPNRDFVVVLSDALWRRRFGADPSIVNREVRLGTRTYTVIGVMPPGFTGVTDTASLWIPFALSGVPLDNRGSRGFQSIARLKPGVSVDAASAELAVISEQLAQAYPRTNEARGVEVSPLSTFVFGSLRPVVLTLMAAVTFVLLIACANVANLLIGRSEVRQREIAVRTALGAGRSRLMRQLVTESCVLAFIAAAAGTALAVVSVRALVSASPVTLPSYLQPGLSLPVLAFTIGVALVCGVLLGLAPAMHARLARLSDALKDSVRGSTAASSHRLRAALVVAEVALAIVLLIGAGLMIRSLQKLTAIDPGYVATNVLTLSVSVPRQPAPSTAVPPAPGQPAPPPPPFVASMTDMLERVQAVPGVTAVGLASDLPLGGSSSAVFYSAEGDTTADAQTVPRAYVHRVSPEFFKALEIPVLKGRSFTSADAAAGSTTVIVSEQVVRRFWPNQDPIGKRVRSGPPVPQNTSPWLTIIGVVPEVKYRGLPNNPTADPDLYFPAMDRSPQSFVIRTSVDPETIVPAVRAAIRSVHPSLIVFGAATMQSLVEAQTATSRFTTWLLGLFAGAALVLSIVGIYGVMSYLVAQRTREFGIRLALGATRREIVRVVLRQGSLLIGLGAVLGIIGTFALARLLDGLLYQVTAVDPSSALAVVVLVLVALVACTVPAVRATRVDPVNALRAE
jgi:predicted permease